MRNEETCWTLDKFLKNGAPFFHGFPDPDIAEKWLLSVLCTFQRMECPPQLMVRLAVGVHKDDAQFGYPNPSQICTP